MPFGVILLVINVGLIVHSAKTGRFWPWGYVILFIPGFEYQAVSNYYPGAEARARYGLLLDKTGRRAEAKVAFAELLTQLKRAPKYVRRVQAEWIALAEKALRN